MRICGQEFSRDLIGRIQEAIRCEPQISRRTLSRQVCQWIEWRSDRGDWQEGGCRKALAELHRRELIELPPGPTAVAPRQGPNPILEPMDLRITLAELGSLVIVAIDDHRREEAKVWRALMERHPYLGDNPCVVPSYVTWCAVPPMVWWRLYPSIPPAGLCKPAIVTLAGAKPPSWPICVGWSPTAGF